MNKQQIFKKYRIDQSHAQWDNTIDNWYSVEIHKIVTGQLPINIPSSKLKAIKPYTDFLDSAEKYRDKLIKDDPVNGPLRFGSCYLTSKRMIYRIFEQKYYA